MNSFTDQIALLLVIAKILLMVVGFIFLISGLDDLFIDICYVLRSVYRKIAVLPKHKSLTEEQLQNHPEKPIAIMLPAWDESSVIRPMLENTLRTLNYNQYVIFVGTYPNDKATHKEVDTVQENSNKVHRIVTPHDGPTNKADCLNWIYQGIKRYEKEHHIQFEIFVMQDCEDVIHPLCYKLFNYLIPRKDMIQLPVLSLQRKWYEFTGAHYLDEFSQLHYKDMVVREYLNRSIPAAGVGCAFSRNAFKVVAQHNNNQVFSIDSLTEDYDFGFRLKQYGLKQAFVRLFMPRTITHFNKKTGQQSTKTIKELVCIREFFPSHFNAAVRQKSRWVLGITLQGWEHLGWFGNIATRYMLFRDRKSIITNLANITGYLLVLIILGIWFILWLDQDAYRYPSLLEKGSTLWYLVIANAFLLIIRIAQRAYCVYQLYDYKQALLSIPRMVWGNLINFLATYRAIRLYTRYLVTGKLIAWDKTAHSYPSEDQLMAFKRKLGDLLLDRKLVSLEQLNEALTIQKQKPARLGEILREMGVLKEDDLNNLLRQQ
jgi:bacteriophage N4 adsorption protein B